ncbi:PTS transporter subunit EIIC [Streptomyces rubrolavendulae]|uniref:PTS system EIIBC component n=1 Tax=Streptomyces rubrolavendulae TaxID=285473 RepID=A0A1D8G290_9ACTN|nr:PTS transporter subunit EIIC [Streptomyces rubrolavendulae]AOT59545.1 PTS system EIIBC component [Streptomyces rubrolavendulae]
MTTTEDPHSSDPTPDDPSGPQRPAPPAGSAPPNGSSPPGGPTPPDGLPPPAAPAPPTEAATPATPHQATATTPHQATAAALLPLVGGAANVGAVAHCMTRLRLTLHDRALVRDAEVRAHPAVLGVVEEGAAYQIVLGPGTVARVTPEFQALLARSAAAPPQTPPGTQAAPATDPPHEARPVRRALRRVANVFVPLIPALIGCGVIAGLNGLLVNLGALPSLTPALTVIASGFMALIAVFVGYNTAQEFGGTPVLGGAVAAIVVYAGVAEVEVFGQPLAPGQGGVLGALAAAFLATRVEKWCRHRVPEALDVLVTPTLTVLVAGLVTVYGLMYAAGKVAAAIGTATDGLLAQGGAAAGFVLGGLFLPLVMLGLHQALIPLHATLIEQQGYTALLPVLAMAGAGQVGAALAVYVRLRRAEGLRRTIRSALPAGLLGVGEPLIYGVTLPLGRPFATACVGGAVGGGVIGLFGMWGDTVGSTAIGPSGWALFPLLSGPGGALATVGAYAAGLLAGYAAGFVTTYFFGLRGVTAPAP